MSNLLLYATTVLIWGSTWLMIKFQLGVVPAEVSVFYRYVLAASGLFIWCLVRGLPLRFGLAAHSRFVMLGLLLFSLNYILAYNAQRFVTSALVAVTFSMVLWMNIVNARIFFGTRSSVAILFGALLGICGICMMFWQSIATLSLGDATIVGALLGIAGAYVASLGNMVSLAAQARQLPIVQSNAWGMLYGAAFTGVIALAEGQPFLFDPSFGYVASLLYLTIFGSIIAFGAYLTLLGRIGAHKAGYATVLFPVVALSLSALFEGMELSLLIIAGMALAICGNFFVMWQRAHASPNPAKLATHSSE